RVTAAGAASPDEFRRIMGSEDVHGFLATRQASLPQVISSIGLVGADGILINGSRLWPVPAMDLSERDYLAYFRDRHGAGVFIGEPVRNLRTGAWTSFLARRISGPHGEFLGVLTALIEVQYFEDFYQAISPRGGSVGILRSDGTLIARYPHLENIIGTRL